MTTPPQPYRLGWFSDVSPDEDHPLFGTDLYQPVLQLNGMVASIGVWFETKDQCDDFIRNAVIPNSGELLP